jgi:hypothetical protein
LGTKETRLKKKEQQGQLNDEEEIELEGLAKRLATLENDNKYWEGEVSKENKPEETSKSFGEADADWIASVMGIDYQYREWTSFTLDEDVKPSTDFKTALYNQVKHAIDTHLFIV